MMTLVMGGSGSGKSEYAESLLSNLPEASKKYYIATMEIYDQEGRKKVERHRRLRAGKGFETIEQPRHVEQIQGSFKKAGALLECMSNLVANEMFSGEIPKEADDVCDPILHAIEHLKAQFSELIIVTNNVFEDGRNYDEATMVYLQAMGRINTQLAAMADRVVEVVVGIPIVIKDGENHGNI